MRTTLATGYVLEVLDGIGEVESVAVDLLSL
jgi:hypothetical protein